MELMTKEIEAKLLQHPYKHETLEDENSFCDHYDRHDYRIINREGGLGLVKDWEGDESSIILAPEYDYEDVLETAYRDPNRAVLTILLVLSLGLGIWFALAPTLENERTLAAQQRILAEYEAHDLQPSASVSVTPAPAPSPKPEPLVVFEPAPESLPEAVAPRGYQLDRSKVSFKITADKTTRLIVENTKEKSDPVEPEMPKPQQPKPEQPTPTPSQPETPKPAPSQPGTSKPSPSQPDSTKPSGKVRLVKLAAGSGAPLPGAVFGVYAQSGEKLSEIISGADGTATLSLPVGRYYLKEQRAPYGYKPETARIRVDVLQNKTTLVEVTNELDPNVPPLPEINVPQTGIPFPVQSYAVAALLFGIAALCAVQLIRSRKNTQ